MAQVERRGVFAWMMADWAGQPFHTLCITFVFTPYFVEYGLGGGDEGQAAWGYMIALAGIAIAVLAPVVGAMADVSGPRKPWIAALSIVHVIFTAALWFGAPGMEAPWMILTAFALALIATELAFIFLNSMLPDLATEGWIGRVSGFAWAIGYAGGLIALVWVLGFMVADPETGLTLLGAPPIWGLDAAEGEGSRMSGPFSAIWYCVFILPMFLLTPDAPRKVSGSTASAGLRELRETIRRLPRHPSLLTFLVSSMFYRDALAALYTFAGIYAVGVLGLSIVDLGAFGVIGIVVGIIGCVIGGYADSHFGPRPVVAVSCAILAGASLVLTLTTATSFLGMDLPEGSTLPLTVFYVVGGLVGGAGGAMQAASRSLMVRQIPEPGMRAQGFGLYGLSGKATAFLAPGLIAIATDITESQRLGVTPVVGLFLIGLVLLYWVKPLGDRPHATTFD